MDGCVSITWEINNFIHCWQKCGEAIASPTIYIHMPEETKWKLLLFPRGSSDPDCTSLFLYRDKECNGAEIIEVEYILQILEKDKSSTDNNLQKHKFKKDMRKGNAQYSRLFILGEKEYLSQDTLIVHCKFIQFVGKTPEIRQLFARTTISVEKLLFQWPVEKFSYLKPGQTRTFFIKSTKNDIILQINLSLTRCEKNICLKICSFDHCMKYSLLNISTIDCQKRDVHPKEFECWFNSGQYKAFQLILSKEYLMENKSFYLPNDVLTLGFKFTISTGIAFEGVENVVCDYTSHLTLNEITENWRRYRTQEKIFDSPRALITDLVSLLEDQSGTDMIFQTKTNAFPGHTSILSARSPVLKKKFSSKLKEKATEVVDVSDFNDETVQQFILYFYTDHLEYRDWEDALQLYKFAGEYEVISLLEKCSFVLKSSLNAVNACKILVFSDLHRDESLKSTVQNFILRNAKDIFKSEEWKILAGNNPDLVIETMLRNWNVE